MQEHRIFVVFLVVAVVVVLARWLAGRLRVPDAIVLVVLGLAAGFIPWIPPVRVSPEVVLYGFLPPLVFHAAFFTAPREARTDAVPIIGMAFGLTAVTTAAVALTVHLIFGDIGWAAALAFGAAVAPTDAVAATAVLQRLGAPARLVTILEGESLINDGVALTIFGLAVEALAEPFTPGHGALRLLQVVAGGVAFGLVLGVVIRRLRRSVRDPASQVILSLATPFLAYIPAEELGFSGVLATVTVGLYLGVRGEGVLQGASRLAGQTFWTVLIFLLESTLFVLLGLEIREVLGGDAHNRWGVLAAAGLAVALVTVAVRLVWELWNAPLARLLPGGRTAQEGLTWRHRLVIGLSGLRGAISLAIALSLPVSLGADRGALIFLTALVVLITLVGQAPALPWLLRRLGLVETDRRRLELMNARKAVLETALSRLDGMAADDRIDERTADAYRQMYELRLDRVRAWLDEDEGEGGEGGEGAAGGGEVSDAKALGSEVVRAQRAKLNSLYRKGRVGADTVRKIDRELAVQDPRTPRALSR